MSSSMWEMDLGGQTVDDIDSRAGRLPDGYYRAKCIKEFMSTDDGSEHLEFSVCHGLFVGKVFTQRLRAPMMASSDKDGGAFAKQTAQVFGSRLGAITKADEGKTFTPNWPKAVGAEVIVKIKTRTFTKKDGSSGEQTEIDGFSIWPLNHRDVIALPNDVRVSLGLPPIAGNPAASQGKTPAAAGNKANGAKGQSPTNGAGAAGVPAGTQVDLASQLWE